MDTMTTITALLHGFGASDSAIAVMGPSLTIIVAWLGAIGVANLLKFPLSHLVKGDTFGYCVRIMGASSAFFLAHYLSDHLTVPLEFVVGVLQPIVYVGARAAAVKWAPWLANSLFRTVGPQP